MQPIERVLVGALLSVLIAVPLHGQVGSWWIVEFEDDFGEPTGDRGVYGHHVSPVTKGCSFVIESARFSRLVCRYFNLTGGSWDYSDLVWHIPVKIDDSVYTAKLTRLESGNGGWFESSFTRKLINVLPNQAEDAVMKISLPYYQHGRVVVEYPLAGLAERLKEVGIVAVPAGIPEGVDADRLCEAVLRNPGIDKAYWEPCGYSPD